LLWANQHNRIDDNHIQAAECGIGLGTDTSYNSITDSTAQTKSTGISVLGGQTLIAGGEVTRSTRSIASPEANQVSDDAPVGANSRRLELLLIADLHYLHHAQHIQTNESRESALALDLLKRVIEVEQQRPRPDAVILLGDLVDHGGAPEVEKDVQELADVLTATGLPVLSVRGNHDVSADVIATALNTQYGPTTLADYQLVTFADTYTDQVSRRTDSELAMIRDLARNQPCRPILVFQHAIIHPPIESSYPYNYANGDQIMAAYSQAGVIASVSGHLHRGNDLTVVDGVGYFVCPALCEYPHRYARLAAVGQAVSTEVYSLESFPASK